MVDVVAYRRRTAELEHARRRPVASGRLARELDLLRHDEAEARRDRAEAAIRAAHARFEVEAAVIIGELKRANAEAS